MLLSSLTLDRGDTMRVDLPERGLLYDKDLTSRPISRVLKLLPEVTTEVTILPRPCAP